MSGKYYQLAREIEKCEVIAKKLKAMDFTNFQSYDFVYKNFKQGEVYAIDGVGYTVITTHSHEFVDFVVIMGKDNIWLEHFQDSEKKLVVKQGVYIDLFTKKEYRETLTVPAWEVSHFKAGSDEDLVLKGRVFRNADQVNITPART